MMTRSGRYICAFSLFLYLLAFSTGSPAFLPPAVFLTFLLISGFLSVRIANRSLHIEAGLEKNQVSRGDLVIMQLTVRYKSFLPVLPLKLKVVKDSQDMQPLELTVKDPDYIWQLPFTALHVGSFRPGVVEYVLEDLFQFFSLTVLPKDASCDLLVLPVSFQVSPLNYSQLDQGLGTMAYATEDITSPSDVRAYQYGDPMKKIHWKLSLQKQELLVRKFEEPVLPDALLILDCSVPGTGTDLSFRDALLETAYSVFLNESRHDHMIHLPLPGMHPAELDGHMPSGFIAETLARLEWSTGNHFYDLLMMQSRRMRLIGATVIVTSRLDGDIVEIVRNLRKMGPTIRFYYVTSDPEQEEILPFISELQQADCEVSYVTPVLLEEGGNIS